MVSREPGPAERPEAVQMRQRPILATTGRRSMWMDRRRRLAHAPGREDMWDLNTVYPSPKAGAVTLRVEMWIWFLLETDPIPEESRQPGHAERPEESNLFPQPTSTRDRPQAVPSQDGTNIHPSCWIDSFKAPTRFLWTKSAKPGTLTPTGGSVGFGLLHFPKGTRTRTTLHPVHVGWIPSRSNSNMRPSSSCWWSQFLNRPVVLSSITLRISSIS